VAAAHAPASAAGERARPRLEALAVPGLLAAAAAAAFGWYVLHGGFYSDDWGNAAGYRLARSPRYPEAVRSLWHELGGRPLLAALLPLPHAAFGLHPGLHLALAAALAACTSLGCYLALRALGLERVDATAIALLGLLFPWADAIELWPTASVNTVAVILLFAGLGQALRGLALRGRAAVAVHAAAALCYLLSVLTYEATGAAALLAGLLYLGRAPARRALALWAADAAAVCAGLGFALVRTSPVRHVASLHERAADVPRTAREALDLGAASLVPAGDLGPGGTAAALAAVAALAGLVAWRTAPGHAARRWLAVGAGCAVAVAASYVAFLGSFLHPLDAGTGSRVNLLARFAYAGLAYAVLAAAARLAVPSERAARLVALGLAGLVAAGYAVRLARDERAWARAAERQREVLSSIDLGLPRLPPGALLAAFGVPASVPPGAPVFQADWDLTGALRIARGDPALRAVPVYEGVAVRCGADGVALRLRGSRGAAAARYGGVVFFDVPTGRRTRIAGRRACARALAAYLPGPSAAR